MLYCPCLHAQRLRGRRLRPSGDPRRTSASLVPCHRYDGQKFPLWRVQPACATALPAADAAAAPATAAGATATASAAATSAASITAAAIAAAARTATRLLRACQSQLAH